MYRHVLVPVDLTDVNRIAVEAASKLAQGKAKVTLLHVVETLADSDFEELEDFYAKLRARAETAMERWHSELAAAGVEADVEIVFGHRAREEIVFGHRAREILGFANESDCDLIVLTSHRVDREHPKGGLGTISHQVALLADCAVLLVR
jgi:nucleotide-binding universal stress UspA family protein